ncbi:MAG: 30S ribosomal protein S3, partial [Dehalococcoidia bacterium]|nr:30S ribosomal protein S3 [Dehalococcoidia bacterium]
MGHKVHPIGFRLGVNKTWSSRWYDKKHYADLLHEDLKIRHIITKGFPPDERPRDPKTRELIGNGFRDAGIPRVDIERQANQVTVTIHTSKPGVVIGKSGAKVDALRDALEKLTKKRVRVNIFEIRQPELDAYLVARSIAEQIERRVSYKRAIKQAVTRSMQRGAKGIKVIASGRLGGAEMSRVEREFSGQVPLQTLRADIDFGIAEAHTTFGVIGVKVWINRGEVRPDRAGVDETARPRRPLRAASDSGPRS